MGSVPTLRLIAAALLLSTPALGAAAGLHVLGGADGLFSVPTGVSADGSTIVGYRGASSGAIAYRWTTDGLGENLHLPSYTAPSAVSNTGIIVGGTAIDSQNNDAFRWTVAGGLVHLGLLPGGFTSSRNDAATSITPDGSVIVGTATHPVLGTMPFKWTESTGMVGLRASALTGAVIGAAVSFDGLVVAGTGGQVFTTDSRYAYRWTQATGVVPLENLPGFSVAEGYGLSGDGKTVIGSGRTSTGWLAFKWTEQTGMVSLGDLGAGDRDGSFPRAISADGSLIAGQGDENASVYAVIWDSAGMHKLTDYLNERGFDTTGWYLGDATGISADGSVIIGTGYRDGFGSVAWVAVVPEPAGVFCLMFSLTLLGRGRLRRKASLIRPPKILDIVCF